MKSTTASAARSRRGGGCGGSGGCCCAAQGGGGGALHCCCAGAGCAAGETGVVGRGSPGSFVLMCGREDHGFREPATAPSRRSDRRREAGGPPSRTARRKLASPGLALAAVELLHEVAEAGAAVALLAKVLAVLVVAAVAGERLDGQGHLSLVRVDVDDLDLHLLAFLDHVVRVLDPLVAHLGDVNQALDAGLDLHEGAEVGDLGDLALQA